MPEGTIRFAKLLELHINSTIKKRFSGEQLTPNLMHEVHACIREQVDMVFLKSSNKLSSEARSWLTDQFFKIIRINDETTMGEQVVMNEYKLEDLPYHDVELLRNLFDQTFLAGSLNEEYKRRSAS